MTTRTYDLPLPKVRKITTMPTFRAPVTRPGMDTRDEGWEYRTENGAWAIVREPDVRGYGKWTLIFRPFNVVMAQDSSRDGCRYQIARGGGFAREGKPPWGYPLPGSGIAGKDVHAWGVKWQGVDMVQRAEGEDIADVREWAEAQP